MRSSRGAASAPSSRCLGKLPTGGSITASSASRALRSSPQWSTRSFTKAYQICASPLALVLAKRVFSSDKVASQPAVGSLANRLPSTSGHWRASSTKASRNSARLLAAALR